MSAMELEQAMEKEPGNPDLNARLAGEFLKRRNYTRSRELALKATQLQPHHPHGSYVLARLALLSGDAARACELLEPALNRDRPDPRVLELLADLRTRTKDYVTASMLYALGQRRFPSDSRWVSGAARVAVLSNNKTALRESLEQLSRLEADDLMPRKKLASMAAEEQDWERAARFAWMSLHIDALDTDSHAILAEALAARNRWQECVEEYRTLQELRPADESIPLKLARAQKSSGDRDGAIRTVSAILEKKPQNMEARQLLDELKR